MDLSINCQPAVYTRGCKGNQQHHKSVRRTNNNLSFFGIVSQNIEKNLKKTYDINCCFDNNDFIAENVNKVVKLFNNLFGKESLPNKVEYTSFSKRFGYSDSINGMHVDVNKENAVFFNSDYLGYRSKFLLQGAEFLNKVFNFRPTMHYLQDFVHEFAHSLHFKHLLMNDKCEMVEKMSKLEVPTVVGKLFTMHKLGLYSLTNVDELLAERVVYDICKNLDSKGNYTGKIKDLDYDNIFSERWKNKYDSPQAYVDYFTQQAWNGELDILQIILDEKKLI